MTGDFTLLKAMTPNAVTQSEYCTNKIAVAVSVEPKCIHNVAEIFFDIRVSRLSFPADEISSAYDIPFRVVSGQGPIQNIFQDFVVYSLAVNDVLVIENRDNFARSRTCCRHQVSELSSARSLFQFPGNTQATRKEYAGRKLVGYSATQMFDVVADVEHYYTFVPFCKKSEIQSKDANSLKANLVIGFPPVVESYTSHVTLVRPHLVKAICTDGKLFNHLLTTWKFTPGLKNNLQTCIIDFYVSFDFNSPLYSHLANIFFNELVRQMESAFYDEAKSRYGKPSIKTIQLRI